MEVSTGKSPMNSDYLLVNEQFDPEDCTARRTCCIKPGVPSVTTTQIVASAGSDLGKRVSSKRYKTCMKMR